MPKVCSFPPSVQCAAPIGIPAAHDLSKGALGLVVVAHAAKRFGKDQVSLLKTHEYVVPFVGILIRPLELELVVVDVGSIFPFLLAHAYVSVPPSLSDVGVGNLGI